MTADRSVRPGEALLAVGVLFALAWEVLLWTGPLDDGQSAASAWWYVPPAVVTAGTLIAAWPRRSEVRRTRVVAFAAVLAFGLLAVHLAVGGPRDQDILTIYPEYGRHLLETGRLPAVEYPPLAVITFAVGELLGTVRVTLPLLLLPLLLVAWWRAAGRSREAPWIVACVALVPTIVVFGEIKYDALPAALLVLGLLAAARERPTASGIWLGLGGAAKWFPLLAVPVLVVADLARRRWASAARLTAASAGGFLVVHLPFLGQWDALTAPYGFHAARGITGESLPYLPLRLLDLAGTPARPWAEAEVPAWAPEAALAVVVAALLVVVASAAIAPHRAVALAAAAPVIFLLGNRIFSPQFVLPIAAAWLVGLVVMGTEERWVGISVPILIVVTATANVAVWPTASPAWVALGWVLFTAAGAVSLLAFARRPRAAEL
ncbi:MAG: DUF2029 domain-containing protein [Actinobacteria bacterium]|nr:DUF2029 domain-containing protein [Actinomycetota bacterium]